MGRQLGPTCHVNGAEVGRGSPYQAVVGEAQRGDPLLPADVRADDAGAAARLVEAARAPRPALPGRARVQRLPAVAVGRGERARAARATAVRLAVNRRRRGADVSADVADEAAAEAAKVAAEAAIKHTSQAAAC